MREEEERERGGRSEREEERKEGVREEGDEEREKDKYIMFI